MESIKTYETSYSELTKLKKKLSGDQITIDLTKLDTQTAGAIRTALQNVISKRTSEVSAVITTVQ